MEAVSPQAHATLYAQDMLFLTQEDVAKFEQVIQAQALQAKYAHVAQPQVAETTAPKSAQVAPVPVADKSVTPQAATPQTKPSQTVPIAPTPTSSPPPVAVQQQMEEERPSEVLLPSYRGAFERQVLIVHRGGRLSDAEDLMLRNLIAACQLSLKDVAVLDENNLAASSKEAMEKLNPAFILSFGINHPYLGGFEAKYKRVTNSLSSYVWADDLRDLELDKALKRSLWNVLKEQFNL